MKIPGRAIRLNVDLQYGIRIVTGWNNVDDFIDNAAYRGLQCASRASLSLNLDSVGPEHWTLVVFDDVTAAANLGPGGGATVAVGG